MNHAITIGDLLLFLGLVAGMVITGFGALMFMAGGMSDAPTSGDTVSRNGCIVFICGGLVAVACALWLFG